LEAWQRKTSKNTSNMFDVKSGGKSSFKTQICKRLKRRRRRIDRCEFREAPKNLENRGVKAGDKTRKSGRNPREEPPVRGYYHGKKGAWKFWGGKKSHKKQGPPQKRSGS